MIGPTLGRYFFMRYVSITFWFFAGVASLVFIVNFTEFAGRMSALAGYSAGMALGIAALQTPMIMQQAVPFVVLISGIATLISLNRKYELVVTRAAGISAWQFLTPLCLGAFVWGMATLLILNPLAANGFERAEAMEADLRGTNTMAGRAGSPWIKQKTAEGDTIIGAKTVLNQGVELAGATFLRIDRDGDITERVDAKRAYLREGHWELRDANVVRAGELPQPLEVLEIPTNLTSEFVFERLANPETIPVYELPRKIAAARSFGLGANSFAMHFHSLLVMPLLLVAMTLIAATVSMRFERMGQSVTIILGGVLAGFLLYVVSVLVKAFGSAGFVPPAAAAWLPGLVATLFGVTFLLYKEDG